MSRLQGRDLAPFYTLLSTNSNEVTGGGKRGEPREEIRNRVWNENKRTNSRGFSGEEEVTVREGDIPVEWGWMELEDPWSHKML